MPKSLHLSCGSELTRQGISLPLDRYSYGRRLLGLQFRASLTLTPLLNLPAPGRCHPYTSPYGFAELCFAKQSLGPIHCGFPLRKHPFSRSYGVILPSSLTRVLSHTLGFSPRLPVSVCGTGTFISLEAFLGSGESKTSLHKELPHHSSATISGFAYLSA